MVDKPKFHDGLSDGEDDSARPNDATGRNFRNILIWSMAILIVSVGLLFFIVSKNNRSSPDRSSPSINRDMPTGGATDSSQRQGIPPDSL
jgi:hypothetical protein